MPKDDSPSAVAERPRCKDILLTLRGEDLGSHDPRVRDPVGHSKRDEDARRARTEHEHDGDHEHEERERKDDVDGPHRQRVGPAPEVAGEATDGTAEHERQQDGQEADREIDPRAVQQAHPDVPAQLIGAQEMLARRMK